MTVAEAIQLLQTMPPDLELSAENAEWNTIHGIQSISIVTIGSRKANPENNYDYDSDWQIDDEEDPTRWPDKKQVVLISYLNTQTAGFSQTPGSE